MAKNVTKKNLPERVLSFIRKQNLVSHGEKLVVAVSGGQDSVCLLHLLAHYQEALNISLHVAHLNHQLRGAEADADARYVQTLAQNLRLPVTIESKDVKTYGIEKHLSLEEAAREVRYSFLAEVARATGAAKVAVGHTRDDHIETILLHLIRGTGIGGLIGLQAQSKRLLKPGEEPLVIIRPLLETSRQETLAYCEAHQLKPRADTSNLSLSLFRNRLRLELVPLLRSYNPNFDEGLVRLAHLAGDDYAFIEAQASQLWEKVVQKKASAVYLDKESLSSLPRAMQRQLLRRSVAHLLGNLKGIEAEHIEQMLGMLAKPAGKILTLPKGLHFFTNYNDFILTLGPAFLCLFPPLEGEFPLKVPGETVLPGWRVRTKIIKKSHHFSEDQAFKKGAEPFEAFLDAERAGLKLVTRSPRPGDRFQPLGMSQPKKLQDFMVDSKIPRWWRQRIPLLCSPTQTLWVVGFRINDQVKVTPETKEILTLKFERLT